MRRNIVMPSVLTLFVLAFGSIAAKADTYNFSFEGGIVFGEGTFTTTPSTTVAGAQDITGVTGEVNGLPITALLPGSYAPSNETTYTLSDGSYFTIDDVLYTSGPSFDDGGVLFQIAGGFFVNLYQDPTLGPAYLALDGSPSFDDLPFVRGPMALAVAPAPGPTPEPSSFLLLGTGLLGFAGTVRRRFA